MAQKDKVKELVGRGLHSYHTKSLQQIDRIEKKNKEQNHKISILTNELDNDYLTKTEEGSVVSLEHSKEGMVYIDGLEGNTLVNYCTDGAKELTLNGDIDIEGTSVTLTEGVDNGKVDVICEGNTLVSHINYVRVNGSENNLFELGKNIVIKEYNSGYWLASTPARDKDILYFRLDFTKISHSEEFDGYFSTNRGVGGYAQRVLNTDEIKAMANNTSKVISAIRVVDGRQFTESEHIHCLSIATGLRDKINDLFVFKVNNHVVYNLTQLFGAGNEPTQEWCDKNLPYIEGMKSVGELEDNKIEILSRSKNLLDESFYKVNSYYTSDNTSANESTKSYLYSKVIKLKPKTEYTLTHLGGIEVPPNKYYRFGITDYNKKEENVYCMPFSLNNTSSTDVAISTKTSNTFTTNESGLVCIRCYNNSSLKELLDNSMNKFVLLEGTETSNVYLKGELNKKEISLNEPLRGLPNGVKDKFVKIGSKWYIERNCGELKNINTILSTATGSNYGLQDNETLFLVSSDYFKNVATSNKLLFKGSNWAHTTSSDQFYITSDNKLWLRLPVTSYSAAIEYLKDVIIVAELMTPIYEPLEVEPTLNTYTDTTHISNNSTIPCNMQIKNSGYNTIIKPSTLYTVVLDTNKSGTIGINLGGAKVTTTNNVATITTPATLTDDDLVLYGKGIKTSSIRLLEGDKTNYIPSYFEGMQSSFEDKLQGDGTYKMEILSNNKNLLSYDYVLEKNNWEHIINNISIGSGYSIGNKIFLDKAVIEDKLNNQLYFELNLTNLLKPNTTYTLSCKNLTGIRHDGVAFDTSNIWYNRISQYSNNNQIFYKEHTFDKSTNISKITFTTPKTFEKMIWRINFMKDWSSNPFKQITMEDLILEEGSQNTNYVSNKSNKIQFSSIEPLRSVDKNIKDRFVFKDNKLMIERNCGKTLLDGTENWSMNLSENYFSKNRIRVSGASEKMIGYKHKGKLCVSNITNSTNTSFDTDFMNICGLYERSLYAYMPRKVLGLAPTDNDATSIEEKWLSWLRNNNIDVVYELAEPTYEEIPFELQKIILEGYMNGALFFDTNIPPTSTVTYAGETPIVKSVRLNKSEVLNNTNDINDNIVPYLMDMDFRVVCLQLEGGVENISMARLFGGTFEMLQRDILSNRYSKEEYKYRLDAYLSANKITENEYNKLGDMLND